MIARPWGPSPRGIPLQLDQTMPGALDFIGLTKRYGAVTVLSDVSMRLEPGRVHALMGENGAGKSTLIKLIAGVVPADALTLRRDGVDLALRSPTDARAAGFRVIHQELNLVSQLSVAENILLGQPIPQRLGLLVDWAELARRARAALAELGVTTLDVAQQAGSLASGDRMLVKIASALVRTEGEAAPCLYVLDEPTAALSEAEVEKLFTVIARLKAQGAAILYVSHRLAEVMRICDDVTVLRNGQLIATTPVAATTKEQIILHMTGRELSDGYPARTEPPGKAVVCQTENLCSPALSGISFDLHQGEILGISGLAGAGQTEVLRLFLGLERPISGRIALNGAAPPRNPSEAWANGVAYVPQERRSQGLMMQMGSRANSLLPHYRGLRARMADERQRAAALAASVSLKSAGPEQPVWQLSGGNQQKVVFARALAGNPRLLLLDEPTRGVDVGAKFEIYRLIRALAAQGCGVLLSSTDLPELLGLCDRILVLQGGRQSAILDPAGMAANDLLHAFYGPNPVSEAS